MKNQGWQSRSCVRKHLLNISLRSHISLLSIQVLHYCEARNFVRHLKVVNDCAERGVANILSYCNILTKDSDMRKWLINTVETHKKNIQTSRKRLLIPEETIKYSTVQ